MEEAGDPCELSPVHYLQEKKKRGKERRKREKNKRIKNNLYLSIAPFINLRFDISACIYISLSQLLVDKTTELRPFVHHVPRFENIGGGGGGGGGFVIGIVRWWKGTEDTRDSHGAGTGEDEGTGAASESRRVDRRRLENQSNPFDCSETRTAAGCVRAAAAAAAAAHGATDGTHAPKMRVTLPKNSINVSVPCGRRGQHERRPTTKLPHCSHGMLTSSPPSSSMLISTYASSDSPSHARNIHHFDNFPIKHVPLSVYFRSLEIGGFV